MRVGWGVYAFASYSVDRIVSYTCEYPDPCRVWYSPEACCSSPVDGSLLGGDCAPRSLAARPSPTHSDKCPKANWPEGLSAPELGFIETVVVGCSSKACTMEQEK